MPRSPLRLRRRPLKLPALALTGLALLAPGALAASPAGATPLVVGVSGAPSSHALGAAGVRRGAAVPGVRAMRVTTQAPATDAARALREVPGVRYAEPVYRYRPSALPDDALLPRQWELIHAPAMGAPSAWRQAGSAPVTVAVVDTGVDLGHPDLIQNAWTNPGEIPGNGIDDDADGLVDDIHGWNFATGTPDVSDSEGHGTSVAGVIAARGGNGIGIAGVAWRARVMALKVTGADGSATSDHVAAAIAYAVAHGARVVNVSLNGPDRSAAMEDAVRAAQDRGVIVTASAGNDGADLDGAPSYPASYPESAVVAVGATERDGGPAAFSNRGSAVDVYAPGTDILSTDHGDEYATRSGTSLAAPHVAGTLALLAGVRPALNGAQLLAALRGGTRSRSGVRTVDAGASLASVLPTPRISRLHAVRRGRRGHVRLTWRAPHGVAAGAYVVWAGTHRVAVVHSRGDHLPRTAATVLRVRHARWRVTVIV